MKLITITLTLLLLASCDKAQSTTEDTVAVAENENSHGDDLSNTADIENVAEAPAPAQGYAGSFAGYDCTEDCSGHEAGYKWAEEHDIDSPDDCGGNSNSFIEGCMAYADEVSDDADDGGNDGEGEDD